MTLPYDSLVERRHFFILDALFIEHPRRQPRWSPHTLVGQVELLAHRIAGNIRVEALDTPM
ncbi:MAG: hypothetical protein KC481_12015, partial [Acidimicrobiaceae bacterium]|nr:hypothetical protein [Acidimicrobiaceae bacterium]